jgi:hypothetical protein
MEDGPEDADGSYDYAGKRYRLEERDSEVWLVSDGDRYLGDLIAASPANAEGGPTYLARCVGEELDPEIAPSDDWHSVLEWLIDRTAPPVGA